ncbi:UNVERIFIED_CONTAM: protein CANDIDATE G-PROTEIN COUPLED RECEPTOR 7 [Sesamum latifolium]|uniref:Protein CANDIDATE G-PROTEIN COUPLED RECEPTOR 7 n=1 Tax=Sesamum latifolium TaxID=2727402 RepID=A0AAW2WYL6_9LAMI
MSLPLVLLSLLSVASLVAAEVRFSEIRSDGRPIIPFDEFGFTHRGRLELNITKLSLSGATADSSALSKVGFFLSTRDAWVHVLQQIEDGEINCVLGSDAVQKVYTFDRLPNLTTNELNFVYAEIDADQYTLVFANCLPQLKVSMSVRSAMYNLEDALNLLCEAEDKSYIKRTGSAHGWDVLFYIFSFLKGITLFSLIVLIGTGWSFLKPYLQDKDKKVLMIVIPLQVVANIAQVVIDETGPFRHEWVTWKQVFLLVDVICCCAVLFPIVWSIKNLREAARTDGKAAVNLMKLTLFRHYYVVVICYIYFTRVVVYALETITSYKYLWTSIVAGELATLAFYLFTGYKFKPEAHNPYFVIDEDEDAATEQLKLEDEFEL